MDEHNNKTKQQTGKHINNVSFPFKENLQCQLSRKFKYIIPKYKTCCLPYIKCSSTALIKMPSFFCRKIANSGNPPKNTTN